MMGRVSEMSRLARASSRRRFRIAVVVVSVVGAAVGSALLAKRSSSAQTTTRGVTATLRVPGHPVAVSAGPDALWVALSRDAPEPTGDPRLVRLDLATRASARPVYLGAEVTHLARVGSRLVASVQHRPGIGQLAALDWSSGAVRVRHWYEGPIAQTVLRGGKLWALQVGPPRLLRLDPRTLDETSAPLPLARSRTLELAAGHGYLWVTAADTGEVLRIDPATRKIARVHVGGVPAGIAVSGGSVWFADRAGGVVRRLDPGTLRPVGDPIRVGQKPNGVVAVADALFVTDQDDGTVVRIDVSSGKKVGLPIRIGPQARDGVAPSVAPAAQSVWVSSFASNTLNRIDPTSGRESRGRRVTVRIAGTNDKVPPVTDGSLQGIGHFTASGAISGKGKVAGYRTFKGALITLRFVTTDKKGTITFVVEIDTNFGEARWHIASATKAYKGLQGSGIEKENADYTVQILTGTVTP
jgi:hypothetical protein